MNPIYKGPDLQFSTYADRNLQKGKLMLREYLLRIQYGWEFVLFSIAIERCLTFCNILK